MGRLLVELEPIVELPEPPKPSPRKPFWGWLLLFGLGAAAVFAVLTLREIAEWEDGKPRMSEKWRKQMEKEQNELDNAEQYVLLATMDGYYPCLKCSKKVIYLHVGEVWKYGVTKKGQAGRYQSDFLQANNLQYLVQFEGNIRDCLWEEKRKIFSYPFLPENYKRPFEEQLLKPPGNLRTD